MSKAIGVEARIPSVAWDIIVLLRIVANGSLITVKQADGNSISQD